MKRLTLFTLTMAAIALAAHPAAGNPATAPAAEGPTLLEVTIRPQATTRPALKHRLLPALVEMNPGDGAGTWLTAALLANREDRFAEKLPTADEAQRLGLDPSQDLNWTSVFLDAPLDKIRSPELDRYLAENHSVIKQLEAASLRETSRWDLPLREHGVSTLLPHLAVLRNAARIVCVKARSELAAGRPEAAIRTLRTNYAMVRALDQQPVLVQSLVAAAIAQQTNKVVREAAGVAGSPNLYWALTDLPSPMLDMRHAMQWEKGWMDFAIPEVKRIREGRFTEQDWTRFMQEISLLSTLSDKAQGPDLKESLRRVGLAAMLLPTAKRYLASKGMAQAELDSAAPYLLLGRYMVESFDEIHDEMSKWVNLPYWQAAEGMQRFDAEFRNMPGRGMNPMFAMVPAVNRAVFSVRRLDRDIAMTRTVEALRDYAARHGGALPANLADVTETPVPIDPIHGKPFLWKLEAGGGVLESPAPRSGPPKDGVVLRIRLVK